MDSIPQTSAVEHTHYVWEDDENESFCGLDLSNKRWAIVKKVDCTKCLEIDRFLTIFKSFNSTYDVRDSLYATVKIMSSETDD